METYEYEYTDTFAGEANYCWVKRGTVTVPDLTHYGYDGSQGYWRANAKRARRIITETKRELGLSGVRHKREEWGDCIVLRFPLSICFITYCEESACAED
jgi:hypothetical protein